MCGIVPIAASSLLTAFWRRQQQFVASNVVEPGYDTGIIYVASFSFSFSFSRNFFGVGKYQKLRLATLLNMFKCMLGVVL